MLIALRLYTELPDDPNDDLQAHAFVDRAIDEYAGWIRDLPIGIGIAGSDTDDTLSDVAAALALLPTARLREAGLDALHAAGIIPIAVEATQRTKHERQLALTGLTPGQIARCLAPD
jgi:hypothetical protein